MSVILNFFVGLITKIHHGILSLNDSFQTSLSDKQLHFIVIGILGIGLFFLVHALFKWLSKRSITAISWIYAFTLVVVIAFAIEIGQRITGSGAMEFADILYGLWGFMAFFAVYLGVRFALKSIKRRR